MDFGAEFADLDFNDLRLTKRAVAVADSLGKRCHSSIPAAANGRAEMEAIYRFMDNPKVTPERLTRAHREATLERIRQCKVILLAQDTTELDLTRPSQQVAGSGPLTHESRHGGFFHPLLALTPDGTPLGIPWYKSWVRDEIITDQTKSQKRQQIRDKPISEKESIRWVEGVQAASSVASECPDTTCVVIGDSESDIYEVLAESRAQNLDLIVRAAHDRNLEVEQGDDKLLAAVRATPSLFTLSIDVSKRTQKTRAETKSPRKCSREGRIAEVEVRAASITIRSPRNSARRQSLTYNAVLVEEASPPQDEPAIQWILLTSLPIATPEQVQQVVHYYSQRWQIEIYFRTLKSGCRIQERYFETMNRIENCIAIYSVIAWKVFYLCRLGRECPDLPCDTIFSDSEWKSVYMILLNKKPPRKPPTINEMIKWIATLGGHILRGSTNPGTQTLWLGLQRLFDFANAWESFGPESPTPSS